jgi:hypothetical protein
VSNDGGVHGQSAGGGLVESVSMYCKSWNYGSGSSLFARRGRRDVDRVVKHDHRHGGGVIGKLRVTEAGVGNPAGQQILLRTLKARKMEPGGSALSRNGCTERGSDQRGGLALRDDMLPSTLTHTHTRIS